MRQWVKSPLAAYLIIIRLAVVVTDRIGGHDLARIGQVALGLICCRGWSGPQEAGTAVCRRALLDPGLAWSLTTAATLHAAVPTMAARELAIFAGMVAIALVVVEPRDPIEEPARLANTASAGYVAVILLPVVAAYHADQPLNRAELFVGYDNYRFFNHVQSAALPLAVLAMTVATRRSWLRGVAWFSAIGGLRAPVHGRRPRHPGRHREGRGGDRRAVRARSLPRRCVDLAIAAHSGSSCSRCCSRCCRC